MSGVNLPIEISLKLDQGQLDQVLDAIHDGFERLRGAIADLKPRYHFRGGHFMRRYAQDRPADTVTFSKAVLVDSEGGVVDPQPDLKYTFSSDKGNIADVVDNGDGTVTVNYGSFVKLEDGSYDIATLKAESNEITAADGSTLKDVVTEQVQLVPGGVFGFGSSGGFNLPEA
jgi:hypothetical protein